MLRSIVSALTLTVCCASHAAPVLDQELEIPSFGSTLIWSFGYPGPTSYAQGFQQSMANISGAGVLLVPTSEPADITISLYDAIPNEGGAVLASGAASASAGWLDVFWPAVAAVPNTTYYLVIEPAQDSVMFWGQSLNGYPQGQAYDGSGSYLPLSDVDFIFRTYADVSGPIEVPEPASLALVVSGLALIATRRRKSV